MRIIGCDLHARQQTLAMLDTCNDSGFPTPSFSGRFCACGTEI